MTAPYIVGLDLGQSQDFSALVIVEQTLVPPAQPLYAVRWLHRWELGTPYPTILRSVEATLARPPLAGRSELIVDHTGCGRPIADQLRQAGMTLIAVSLHGGDTVSHVGANFRTPKRDLVAAVQLTLQQQRLQFAATLPLTAVLTQELLSFRVRIDPATAHDSYSAWRERDHDDLVLALALAVWWAEYQARDRVPDISLATLLDMGRPSLVKSEIMDSVRRRWDVNHDEFDEY
jgi:hypothetical protein